MNLSEQMKRSELIFIPAPGVSHLVPTLEFAKKLIHGDGRFSITILTMKNPLDRSNVDAYTYTKSLTVSEPQIQVINIPEVEPPPHHLLKCFQHYFTLLVERHIPNVTKIVKDIVSSHSNSDCNIRVSGLVLDFFCASMTDVAAEFGLSSYVFMTSNAGYLSLMLHLPTHRDQNCKDFIESADELLNIPGFVNPVPASVLPLAMLNKEGYTAYLNLAKKLKNVNGILVNTFCELESYAVKSFSTATGDGLNPPVYTVGPILNLNGPPHPESDEAQSEKILKWLDDQPESSVVFLCLGSSGRIRAAQVKEIAIGLEQSEYKFLWSLKVADSPEHNHHDIFPEGFLERVDSRGMICEWASQVQILAHKAVGGFVSHCGWNSILESLWYGVPIVTWPLYAEQQLNAFEIVKELGLAVELRLDFSMHGGDVVMANELEIAIRRVMDGDSELRNNVKEMSEFARNSVMDGGSSFTSLAQFIGLNF